jgi:predicted permease
MRRFAHDLKLALRALVARPLYSGVTLLVLALAIGANTTVFSVYNGLFLRALPYPDGDRLVSVYNTYPRMGLEMAGTSIPDYLDRSAHAGSLESLAIYTGSQRTLGGAGDPERLQVQRVSPSLFEVLGVPPLLGRGFSGDEATPGNDRVAVISHALWQSRLGGRSDILGQDIRLDGEAYRVVGVMPPGFGFPSRDAKVWLPFAFTPEQMSDSERGNEFSQSIGRLRPGASIEALEAEFADLAQQAADRAGNQAFLDITGFAGRAKPLREMAVGNLQAMLLLLQGSVLAVLLIACANVANLQLARMAARRKELSVRAALGAGQGRLLALVLSESLILAFGGALLGMALALGGLELVRALGLDRASQGFEFAIDHRVLLFTAASALLVGVLSAALPMLAIWRESPARTLQEAGRIGGGRQAQRVRSALVVAQLALSVTLLVAAGLLTRGFNELERQGPGFDATQLLTARIAPPANRYAEPAQRAQFYQQALEALRALPGVTAAGFTSVLPFTGSNSQSSVVIEGYEAPEGVAPPHAQMRSIDEGYLAAMGIPVIQGRGFDARERERVAIIDQNMARRYWPEGDALGQRIRRSSESDDVLYTIVGVVPAVRHDSLAEDPRKETVYWHYLQWPESFGVFVLRSALPVQGLARQANAAVTAIDPDLPLFDVLPMQHRLARSLGPQRTPMVLTQVFGAVAFLLAMIGIYGVLTWAVTQRFGELGVRMALGAGAADVTRMVMGQGVRLMAVGLLLGLAAAVAGGRLMAAHLQHVRALDPLVIAVVLLGLVAAALFACYLPARRAARTDPLVALRHE